jgi:hypothetical protein
MRVCGYLPQSVKIGQVVNTTSASTSTQHNAFNSQLKDSVVPLCVDQTVFLKTWLKRPMRTGAVVPSSNALARLMLDVNYIDRSATTILAGGSGG